MNAQQKHAYPAGDNLVPFYVSDRATLYRGDCLAVLPELGECADLIVTDPPYGVDFQSNRRAQQFSLMANDENDDAALAAVALALRSNLNRYRHAYIFGPFDLSGLVADGLIQEPVELIWDKGMMGMGNVRSAWGPQHELIQFLVAVRSKANVKKGEGKLTARLRKGSVLRHQRPHAAGVKRHPTEKPVPLLRELVESSSAMGEVVLDPFAGSGSTLVAALLSGRCAVGVEVDEGYCEVAADRLRRVETMLDEMEAA